MSFLNNSLKNAQQTRSKDRVPAGCPPYLQMDFHASKRSNLVLVVLLAGMMVFTGLMIRAWYRSGHIEMKARARTTDSAVSRPAPAPVAPEEPKAAGISTNTVAEDKPIVATTAETPKVEATVYKLQGVVFDPGHSTAVINGKTVAEGERVDSARVLSITKDSAVILTAKGETQVLDLQ